MEGNLEEDVRLLKDITSALSEKVYEASSEQRKEFASGGCVYVQFYQSHGMCWLLNC